MASELSATLFRASWPGLTTPAQVAAAQLRIDALLAPVRKFISLVNSKPGECESMKKHALEILASLDPNPEATDGE